MSIDPNELIHTQVTRPQIPVVDDGVGNYNISPIGFPVANRSEDNNPTLFNPGFVVDRNISSIVSTNISPLSGLHSYTDGQRVTLTAQSINSENGDYIVRTGVWDRFIEYKYDGTEADNKEGYYDENDVDGNPLNHFRKGYSHREVSDFIRDNLSTSLNFGRVSNSRGNGALYKWFFDGDEKVNIGGASPDKSVFVDSFGSIRGYRKERTTTNGPITDEKIDFIRKLNIRERKLARWSLSNHHTEAMYGRNKSPFVRDYPFNYNSATTGNIFAGGMHTSEVEFDKWRIGVSGSTATTLRPFCDSALFYQRENGYHNNITLDMTKSSSYGRHHISILHHLDHSDVSPNNPDEVGSGTTYTEYRDDLLMAELDTVANVDIGGGYVVLYKDVVDGITKYYYHQREKESVTIEQYGVGTWSPTNLLWEDASGTLRIYVTSTGYVTYNASIESVAWMLNNLINNNDMIPVPFIVPTDPVDRTEYLKDLNVLFISNDLVDHTQSVNRSEKIRSKKTFVHLPTPVDLVDGQQIEIDVSLPMISDQDAFKFNTIGSLAGYMNYMTQPRVQVFSGVRKCYDYLTDSIKNNLKINSISRTGTVATITSNGHGIIGSSRIELYGCSDVGYNRTFIATVTGLNTLTITVPNTLASSASGYGYRLVKVSEINISSFTVTSGVATITTGVQHGIIDAEDILINLSGNGVFSDIQRAIVVDQYNISFSTAEADQVISSGSYFIKSIEVAHATNFVHEAYLDLSAVDTITRVGSVATVTFVDQLVQTIGEVVSLSVSGCVETEYNGDFVGTITATGISYTVSGTPATPASGVIRVTATMDSSDMGYGSNRSLSGESVEGLTERKNQYLYSPMPEVEFATDGNIYHQHKMSTSDIDSSDKRVLLANVYPTSTNTFAWRMDKDPQIKMLKWSVLATTSANGSAAFQGYSANKTAYDKIAPFLGTSRMSLYDSPIAYEYDAVPEDTNELINFLMSRIRVLMQENVVPTESEILTDQEAITYGSMTYQSRKGFLESIATFQSTRIGVKNSSTLEPSLSDAFIGYDDNGVHADDISVGNITSLLQFNTGDVPNPVSTNDSRWLSKAIYTPDRVVNATGYTAYVADDVYNGVDTDLKDYLVTNFGDGDIDSNSGDRYIPTQLNSPSDPKFPFGIGSDNAIYNFLIARGVSEGVKADFKLALHDWYSPIDNTPVSGKYGVMRDMDRRFTMTSGIESLIKFYGMTMIPFAKIFSTDSVNPVENVFPSMVDFSTIMTTPAITSTLINSVTSNPALLQYATHIAAGSTQQVSYENTMIGINSTALEPSGVSFDVKDSVSEYFRNHISGYAANMPIRFYNSFRIGVHGDSDSINGTDHEDQFVWINNLRNYTSEFIGDLPSAVYGTYIDDNFYLINSDLVETYVNDSNDARVTLPGRGKSATAKIIITDWSELLDGGFASVTVNGVVFTATLSDTPSYNEFTVVESDIDTATNLSNAINFNTSGGVADITTDNYSGLSNIITLTVSASVGSAANSYDLVFTPSSVGNTGMDIVGFSGGQNAEDHAMNSKVSISGQQYLADSQFYSSAMRSSYIRMKMRFVFSAQCGRWLTMDYRQCPTSYLTPGVGNKAYAKKERSIVKTGLSGKITSDYIFVTEDNFSTVTNRDYLWVMNNCFNPDDAYKSLWCTSYSEMKPMEMNRFCLPFFCEEFPYDSDGHLKSEDSRSGQDVLISGTINASTNQIYNFNDLKYPEIIGFVTPMNVNGTGSASVVAGLPHPWAFSWHMRPVSTALGYGVADIPSPTARIGGLPSDPALHNMFDFPCRVSESSDPCYLIPWHEDMGSDWLMYGMVSIESAIVNDVNRSEKLDIDAIMENYDWETNSPIDPSEVVDEDRTDFLEIESDRPIS